ncbi:nuclear receptor binding SET domain protein [Eurosta solidaginis]|uniref:nuclear receptor binding SET domain protein n=1 Tax=Eurosta solidaginis TaxID=178769 RepID=UPI0035309D3C
MRADKKQSRESRRRVTGNGDAAFGRPVGEISKTADSNKNISKEKSKINSCVKLTRRRQNSEPQMITPTAAPTPLERDGGEKKNTSISIGCKDDIGSINKLSLSTPRRKRDLLAELYSDLSPKYIGFTTPPTGTGAANNGSESDGGLQTRSTRRRKLLIHTASPDIGGSDSELLTDATTTLLGRVRRTRNQAVTPPPTTLAVASKNFLNPIEKLLVRNGSAVLCEDTDKKLANDLDSLPTMSMIGNIECESELEKLKGDSQNEDCTRADIECINTDNVTQVEQKQEHMQSIIAGGNKTDLSFDNGVSQIAFKVKNEITTDEENGICQADLVKVSKNDDTSTEVFKAHANELHATDNVANPCAIMKTEADSFEKIVVCNSESIDESRIDLDNSGPIQFDTEEGESGESLILNNAAGLSVKSPSAASLDSAKGSSIITGNTTWNSFATGDLFWGQIYTYCYWPCIVCPDPDGKTINTERKNGEEYILVHVRFFADSGRRNWVKRENLIPFTDLEHYKQHMRTIRKKYGKKSYKYKQLLPVQKKVGIWREAIKEAYKVAELLHEERLPKFFEMYEHKKVLLKLQRVQRKLSVDNRTSSSTFRNDTMENLKVKNPLTAVKRDRSASPYSPAYSPLKSLSSIKRRKLTDAEMTQNPQTIQSESTCAVNPEQADASKNASSQSQTNEGGEANTSNSFTSLHESDLKNNDEYRKFYTAMREFVLEDNKDDSLEKSLTVAVRNIWALKQINRQQMQRRLLLAQNETELLGSTLIDSANSNFEGITVKRLSNRLKTLKYRHSLPAKIKDTSSIEHRTNIQQTRSRVTSAAANKPKPPLNRPIEEVIDDIFNLDNKYLFRGLARDPVCKYCLRPGGALYKCAKGCQAWMHEDCIGKTPDILPKKKWPARRKSSSSNSSHTRRDSLAKWPIDDKSSLLPTNESQNIQTGSDRECDTQSLAVTPYHVTADAEIDNEIEKPSTPTTVICDSCAKGKPPTCSVCGKDNLSTGEALVVCNMINCGKAFHHACCRYWPQAKFTKSKNQIETFRCPSHVCHTCVSDDPKGKFQHLSNAKLTKCVKCPASYHMDSTCIPAGSQILTAAHIICSRHSTTNKSDAHVNVNWCFICVGGGQVICCETCPTAVHAKCLNIALDPSESYICEECESGRLPLYGEMVWAKFTSFRWWPAIILPPTEIPQNIRRRPHNSNEFVVRFFGTHDHGWISRRRVYLYLEGDSSEPPRMKSSLDYSYNKGVEEAKRIYEILKSKKLAQRLSNENKEKLHPQPYVRIKANRAVHPVKLHVDLDKVNKCECNKDDEEPCGPNSDCLNRVLYHECNPKVCPAGERCQNQMFESRLSPRLDVVFLRERGFGLVCREPIKIGEFVIEYVGEIIDDNEFKQRVSQKSLDRDENFYFLSVEKDYIIDAGPKGNLARFMNHSCDPNCETQKWSVNGLNRIGLFAIKDIPADTELTFNYHWDDLLGNEKKVCLCGAVKCAGEIGGKTKEERPFKEHSTITDVSKTKPVHERKRKPLKRLRNRVGEDSGKNDNKKPSLVNVKMAEEVPNATNTSSETINLEKQIEDNTTETPTAHDEKNYNAGVKP